MTEKKDEERYTLTEVVTQTDIAVKDNTTGNILTDKGLIVEILNKLDKIEKGVAWLE